MLCTQAKNDVWLGRGAQDFRRIVAITQKHSNRSNNFKFSGIYQHAAQCGSSRGVRSTSQCWYCQSDYWNKVCCNNSTARPFCIHNEQALSDRRLCLVLNGIEIIQIVCLLLLLFFFFTKIMHADTQDETKNFCPVSFPPSPAPQHHVHSPNCRKN